ncbi:hypothetical protein AMQ84_12135 [Paenibacillus riograndensis]|uniref:Lipoprotein n=1 Tax=Paenibacillus riograndensis TaxID=483937 RepID=A0A132U1N5_9BACL|nr:hypothetical protein [Paenibacillus riograndensis]KWX77491.1 hypothetical protein AMQ84_12135 [Paenibacillus riograndensis]
MIRHILPCALLLLMITMLTGCTSDSVDTPLYEGQPLEIGIIGDAPAIRERNISFTGMSMDDLKEGAMLPGNIDAVFITKDHLSEAAEPQYAQTYKKAGVPFFFIESMKSYIPFVYEDLSYEEVPDMQSGMYATGYYQSGGKMKYWGYGLYNDKVNSVNIKDAYSRIFATIASLS